MALFRRRPPGRHAGPAAARHAGTPPPAPAAAALPPWEQTGWTPPSYAQPYLEPTSEDVPSPLAAPDVPVDAVLAPSGPVLPSFGQPQGEWPSVLPAPAVPEQAVRRVELGFRDGSVAALAPDSVQARALSAIVDVLVRRD